MATALVIEEDRGTYVRSPHHPHNGYYAGDFHLSDLPLPQAARSQSS